MLKTMVLWNYNIINISDKTYSNIAAVDRLLNKADYGDDFTPTCLTLLKNHSIVFTSIDPEIKVIVKLH